MKILIIDVVVLAIVEAGLLYGLRELIAMLPLSDWVHQASFLIAAVVLLSPVIMPVGMGLALFAPNGLLLPFAQLNELVFWYKLTAAYTVPAMILTATVSWWIGALRFLRSPRPSQAN
jgi:hypothetical protein